MMGGIFTWVIIGVVLYLLFSKRGGMMGCCGGHDHNKTGHSNQPEPHSGHHQESDEDIIDLRKEDFHVKTQG